MPRDAYQDEHPEVACPTCEGAGFFGNGPYVEFCAYCHGTGVLIDEREFFAPERKPVEREYRREAKKVVGGEDEPF